MSTLLEELNKNKAIEDAVQPNKMSKFAYTEQAYEDNDASGVDSFDFEADQNIPSDKLSVLQTNETVILKGFRAQASSVTRQLLNHFFGRASYNLNKVHDVVKGVLDAFVNFIGKANGIATLDENGRIPYSQLPESAMEFKGTWDASTNTPTLADGTGDTGDFYVVSVAGTQDLGSGEIKFLENDRVIYSDAVWSKLSGGDVRTVNNIQPTDGNVTLTGDNINFSASDATKVSAKVTSHINATTDVHGATSAATANKIAIRDASGRLQVATPSAANDAANKSYVDSKSTGDAGAVQTNLTNHINNQASGVHGATPEATAGKLIIRDSSGRAKVANPSAVTDIANKQYVDNKTWNANDITAGTLPIARGGTGATTASGVLTNLGVTATAAELNKLDGFTGSTAKLNFTNNVTSDIQSQLNGKAKNPGNPGTPIQIKSSGNRAVTPGWYLVELWGGGGGGGGGGTGSNAGGGGGGGGGSHTTVFLYIKASTINVTIGQGGRANMYSDGYPGGTTSVTIDGVEYTATGGGGGGAGTSNTGGIGGSGNALGGKGGNYKWRGSNGTTAKGNGGRGGMPGGGDQRNGPGGGGGGGGGYGYGGDGGYGGSNSDGGGGAVGELGGGGGGGGGCTLGSTGGIGGYGGDGIVILTPFNA